MSDDEIANIRKQAENSQRSLSNEQLEKLRKETNIFDCDIYQNSEVWLIKSKGVVLYYETEFPNPNYHYFRLAFNVMSNKGRDDWKTVEALITFRLAIREMFVQGTDLLENFLEDYERSGQTLTKKMFDGFLSEAREQDAIHHGQVTF